MLYMLLNISCAPETRDLMWIVRARIYCDIPFGRTELPLQSIINNL